MPPEPEGPSGRATGSKPGTGEPGHKRAGTRQARFAGEPADVRSARHFVADAFRAFDLAGEVHRASLATSELVSNVITHAASGFTVRVNAEGTGITVEVQDHSPALPLRRHPAPSEPTGRGLQIVEQCSQAWGITPVHADGKIVWFEIGRPPAPRPTG